MPTNLPPEYYEVDRRYRAAESVTEKINLLEELISTVPKHKGTDKLRADLRRKLSKLKASAQTKKGVKAQKSVFHIDPEGAGQLAIIGHSNVGKSALVASLTNADPEVAEFPFTTWQPTPGMMPIDNIQVQIIDTPPLNREYLEPDLMDLLRRVDLVLVMVDLLTDPFAQLEAIVTTLQEHRIVPDHQLDRHPESKRLFGVPMLLVVNKNDDETTDEDFEIFCELLEEDWPMIPISVKTGRNIDRFKQRIFDRLNVVRIYSKAPGKDPDLGSPFIMEQGGTVEEFAQKIHQDFFDKLKSARVWGSSDFDGQLVSRDYVLEDEDVVELRI
jgi:small GTP-binding protein